MSTSDHDLAKANEALRERIQELERINASLTHQVERATQAAENSSIGRAAKELEEQVEERNRQLEETLLELERSNEELTIAKEKAEASAHAKSQFLATMSHEIRTPMNGLVGVLTLIEDGLPASKRKLLKTAQNCSEDLLLIINDILDISKIEAGKMNLERIVFDARELLESVCELHSASAHAKGLEIVCDTDPQHDYQCLGDPLRIRQVISNIVSNAVKFTDKGEVVVKASVLLNPIIGNSLFIEIMDTGVGISAQAQERLFETFSQANSSTTRKFGGTGLGLAIAKKFVELMGGEIGVASNENVGTTFWLQIPHPNERPHGRHSFDTEKIAGKRVLIVDSNETNRAYLSRWLTYWDCQVTDSGSMKDLFENISKLDTPERPSYDIFLIDQKRADRHRESWKKAAEDILQASRTRIITLCRAQDGRDWTLDDPNSLAKPVTIGRLHDCLAGNASADDSSDAQRKGIAFQRYESLRLLLVDDNITNRLIASQLLEQRHGIKAKTAANGIEALETLRDEPYDIVLMDCMMPDMDGYEASRAIRRGEVGATNKDVIIIALTANAMSGDREECLAAGMDDYLTKPLRAALLAKALHKWVGGKKSPSVHKIPEEPRDNSGDEFARALSCEPLFDPTNLIEMYEEEYAVINNLLEFFLSNLDDTLSQLQEAVESNADAERLRFLSHQIKGSAANYGAQRLFLITKTMEQHCVQNEKEKAISLFPETKEIVSRTIREIAQFSVDSNGTASQ
ncbi:ATP-binding protein [Pelagicoccus sp. SDUM812003]|uniref:ATP-binding protein n=1 Tax=Pelagicoccus sp. SDUM812003 TaxID=3041267 RepID=UPI00280E2B97|nr:ATP-binding protein [Pelagicoccus sp. SDUM812003]MDQ8203799.1 ATP-binding protein [Pelagicoccus sp. SDUM812003]